LGIISKISVLGQGRKNNVQGAGRQTATVRNTNAHGSWFIHLNIIFELTNENSDCSKIVQRSKSSMGYFFLTTNASDQLDIIPAG
jgi:hypothetical protein